MASDDSSTGLTRREFGALAGALTALPAHLPAQTSSEPMLDIAEWSYFWYGVEHVTLARGTVCNGMQIYVERWIPAHSNRPYPIVLIHGGYRQGSDWLSTPDGPRGWATILLEQGYKVYIVDRPGQGRCPYHPWVHGAFDREAPTFEKASWSGGATDQFVAAMGQPMANNPITQGVWRSRSAMLLDDIGPSILITDGDGAVFALLAAEERPKLVKGIVTVEPPATALQRSLPKLPIAAVLPGASANDPLPSTVSRIALPNHAVMPMLAKNNRDALNTVHHWVASEINLETFSGTSGTSNKESTALKLADQGCFWVGVQRKAMPYGTIAQGQMFVQYMIPAERRSPYPVVMVHGGGGQGTHMMGIGGRPGWVHYFVQSGYAVYWIDRPSYGRSPYHPDALGPSHLPNVPPYEGLITSTAVFNTAQWPGPGGMNDPLIGQFMACEYGNVTDEAFHSDLVWRGGAELLDRIGPSILFVHAFGGFFAWGVADRRPNLVKAIVCMEINGNPFAAQLRWGLTAGPMTYDPPVTDPAQFRLVDHNEPPDSPLPVPPSYKLQAEPARKWKNLQGIPIGWLTSEFGGGGSPVANVEFLKQVGCSAEMLRLRDRGIFGNGNLMLLEKNNHEVFGVIRDWLDQKLGARRA
jgi:pimeloyl-ACP methyl ester carboxylesterase